MNDAIRWLYQQHTGIVPPGDAQCYLCGTSCTQEYTVAKGIADTFNSHYLAQYPSSLYLCSACQWYFDSKAGHPDFRKMSLIVLETAWIQWNREKMKAQIDHWLSGGLPADCYLVCSLSKKKHVLLQAPMNAQGSKMLTIQVEEQVAHLDYATWEYIDRRFITLLQLGHNKSEILSGNLYGNTIRKHGKVALAMRMSQQLDPYRNSVILELLSYVTLLEDKQGGTVNANPTGDGDGTHSSNASESCVDSDQSRVQEQVQDGHLVTSREQRGSSRQDEQHIDEVSQPALWEV